MSTALFRPFERYNFSENVCYLTGQPATAQTTIFPSWLLQQFNLAEKPFKMLDENIATYQDIKIPVSAQALTAVNLLDDEMKEALNGGYETIKKVDELRLFQWIAKQVYGIIHWEVRAGIRQQRAIGEEFSFSQSIAHKFSNLHIMLQSLVQPVVFEGLAPWSIKIFPVENPPETFSYRDEINTLVFSLRMKDFGIIACLQDNGESLNYHKEILDKVEGKQLHPIQYEEICANFFYSAYLFNRLPEYTILPTDEAVYVEPMPLRISARPVYDIWQVKTYGQVLENFWKPWGFLLLEIIKNPEKPMSFLTDLDGNFLNPDQIKQDI
ncbi:hypothetical protein ACFSJU_05135 [Paradesertivirga mongoliensis]|uniref:DUF1853 family protein n=1 Tax=Paradesertivirga mongoliensis TaxID=2100740 RepID=A0ABW4ZJQ3_9SPHI|nr:hypothetical protein [Pedobacter mongoliensis]